MGGAATRNDTRPVRRPALPAAVPLGRAVAIVSTVVAVLAVAATHGGRSSGPGWLSALLLVPAGLPAVVLFPRGSTNPVTRSLWWRLTFLGYTVGWIGAVLRSTSAGSPSLTGALPQALATIGLSVVLVGIVLLQAARGVDRMPDVLIDAVLLAFAFGLVLWCVVLRPLTRTGLSAAHGLDFVTCSIATILTALLSASMLAGPIRATAAVWSAAGMASYALSFVVVLTGDDAAPVLAQALWSLCGAYTVVPLLDAHGADREPEHLPWNPLATGLAVVIPVAVYVVEALETGGSVPDARAIGGTLVVLCLGCVLRVQRSVERSIVVSAQLAEMAASDHLTGLANRRVTEARLAEVMSRPPAERAPVSVAMLDLDHFKAYNDRYGHHAGDRLLVEAAHAWSAQLADGRLLARVGGEEFLLVAEGVAAGALCDEVARLHRATPLGQTFSAGVAMWDGDEDVHGLVARADAALYDAKNTGRARTCLAVVARDGSDGVDEAGTPALVAATSAPAPRPPRPRTRAPHPDIRPEDVVGAPPRESRSQAHGHVEALHRRS